MKKLLLLLCLVAPAFAQPSCVQLTDTLYSMSPSGNQLMTGTIQLALGYFTNSGGFTITQSLTTLNITAKVNNLSACLPTSVIVQASYTVTTGGRTPVRYQTYWYIPNTGGPYRLTGVPSGVVNVTGTTVTWVSGLDFSLAQVNDTPTINGSSNVSIASKQSITQITLYSGLGTLTNATYSDGPIERGPTSLTGTNPPSIFGLPGPPGPAPSGAALLTYVTPSSGAGAASLLPLTHQYLPEGSPPSSGTYCVQSVNGSVGWGTCSGSGGALSWTGLTNTQWTGMTNAQWTGMTN